MTDSRKLGDFIVDRNLPIILTNAKPEDGGVDGPRLVKFEDDDIVQDIKTRLGDHASNLTKAAQNNPSIEPGSTEFSLQLANGFPAPLQDDNSNSNNTYTKILSKTTQGRDAVQEFNQISNNDVLTIKPKKGLTIGAGNQKEWVEGILADIHENGGDAELPRDVDRVLEQNNRFSNNNPYVDASNNPTESNSGTKDIYKQQNLGEFVPRKSKSVTGNAQKPITIEDLKNIGIQMMLEGSGEVNVPKKYGETLNLNTALASVHGVPGLARLGQRVSYGRFSAGNIMAQVNDSYRAPEELLTDGPEKLSFGSPWNPLVKFNSLNSASSRVVVALLSLTVSGMLVALSRVLKNSAISAKPLKSDQLNIASLTAGESLDFNPRLGSYTQNAVQGMGASKTRFTFQGETSLLLSAQTENDYTECVAKGIQVFFDFPDSVGGTIGAAFSNNFQNIMESNSTYGYQLTILRSLVRDTTDIFVDGIAGAAISTTPADFQTRGALEINTRVNTPDNPYGIIESAEILLDRIRNSRLLRFMDIIANIGDLALINEKSVDDNSYRHISKIDSINGEDNENYTTYRQSALHQKSRLKNGKLSWGSNTIMSMYMLTDSVQKAQKDITGTSNSSLLSTLPPSLGFKTTVGTTRLKKEDVDLIEEKLESVYVPFYFHDLRTNEVISFHAFLSGLRDDHTADYESTQGIGRIGNTLTYKNTTRTITFDFWVVSTNPEDFDAMWFKVNKLVSMVYPQYTAGRPIINPKTGDKFIQPFSQLVSSSPMVRIRVGDLIKSNLNELDIARLFGAGTNNFNFSNSNREQYQSNQARQNAINKEIADKEAAIRNRINNGNLQVGDTVVLQKVLYAARKPGSKNSGVVARNLNTPSSVNGFQLFENNVKNSRVEIPRAVKMVVSSVLNENLKAYIVKMQDSPSADLRSKGVSENSTFLLDLSQFASRTSIIKPDDVYVRNEARKNSNGTATQDDTQQQETAEDLDNVARFFDPQGSNGNPVRRAFDSTAGKGLAGFITNISFDWEEPMWETEVKGSKAPQMMKISVAFNPIHDINPGIASDGFMIGAPYKVGNIMKGIDNIKIGGTNSNDSVVKRQKVGGDS